MATEQLIGQGFSTILSVISGNNNAKKQRELTEKISKLSLEQKNQLEKRLQDANSASERNKLVFQAIALDLNRDLIRETNKQKYGAFVFVGVGLVLLATVIYLAKRKNG